MKLVELPSLPGFNGLRETDVIKLVIWWSHRHASLEWVDSSQLRRCYSEIHRATPTGGFTSFLISLESKKPPQLIRRRLGCKLELRTLQELDLKYGKREATVKVDKLLSALPTKLANPLEQSYLEEALTCFRNSAFRAAVVMTWNLTYDHICYWVLADSTRVGAFNAQMAKTYSKRGYPPVATRYDFEEPKEFEVLQVLASAGLINGGMHMVLKEKLDRRNKAAHPTGTAILLPTAEDLITDLIENVVLKLQ